LRKVLIAVAGVVVLVVGGATALVTSPALAEKSIEWTCGTVTPRCVVRMRGMGHLWSLKENLPRARHWYALAAAAGDPPAMFHLGWFYEQAGMDDFKATLRNIGEQRRNEAQGGNGGPEPTTPLNNFFAAEQWYRKSADLGFAPAMNNLGQLYLSGLMGRRDPAQAFRWHMAAAKLGNYAGSLNVAMAYRSGDGVAQNAAEADRWSTWRAPENLDANTGIGEPTLSRSRVFGNTIPPRERAGVRIAAERREPLTLTLRPLRPDPSLPTFSEVQRNLRN
jgi:Sel1 repeat